MVTIVVVVRIVSIGISSTINKRISNLGSLNLSRLIRFLLNLLHNRVGIWVAKSISQRTVETIVGNGIVKSIVGNGIVKSIVGNSIVESIVGERIVMESTVGNPWVSLRVGLSSRFSFPLAIMMISKRTVVIVVGSIWITSTIGVVGVACVVVAVCQPRISFWVSIRSRGSSSKTNNEESLHVDVFSFRCFLNLPC